MNLVALVVTVDGKQTVAFDMRVIPRIGESIVINDAQFKVHDITFKIFKDGNGNYFNQAITIHCI